VKNRIYNNKKLTNEIILKEMKKGKKRNKEKVEQKIKHFIIK